MKNIKKAVVPAAGLGTRFLPFTKSVPKEMLPVIDKPAVEYIIEEIVGCGIEDILLINGRHKVSMIDYFDRSPELELRLLESKKREELDEIERIASMARIYSVRQKEPLGLGHAVLCAKNFTGDDPFAVLLGDDIIYNDEVSALKQLIEAYKVTGSPIIGVQPVAWKDTGKFGIVTVKEKTGSIREISRLVEKPKETNSNLAVVGRYILPPRIYDILESIGQGAGGEIQLTDAIEELLHEEKVYACILSGRRYDLGSKEGFLEATVETALRREDLSGEFKSYLSELFNRIFG